MKAVRAALVVVILLDLALLACYGPSGVTLMRYGQARQQTELRKFAVENRSLQVEAARARRPDRVAATAIRMGVDVHRIESEAIVKSAGTSPASQPAVNAPRR